MKMGFIDYFIASIKLLKKPTDNFCPIARNLMSSFFPCDSWHFILLWPFPLIIKY